MHNIKKRSFKIFSKQRVFNLNSEVNTSSHQSWSTDSHCSQKCHVLSFTDMHTSPLGYFTCFLVRVFPVLSLMYLAINSFLPETKKKCIMKDKNIISTNTIKIPHLNIWVPCVWGYIFLHLFCFSFANYLPVFLIFHQYFSSLCSTDIACATPQRAVGSGFSHRSPAGICRQRSTSLASGDSHHVLLEKPLCWVLTQGLGSSGFASNCAGWSLLPQSTRTLLQGAAALKNAVCHPSTRANPPDFTVSHQLFSKF